jgi:hypothetical protein
MKESVKKYVAVYSTPQKNFKRIPCYIFRRKALYIQTQSVPTSPSNGRVQAP